MIIIKTKVYIVYVYVGDGYEGSDYVLNAYFDKEVAEKKVVSHNSKVDKETERTKVCDRCPAIRCQTNIKSKTSQDKFIEKMKEKCEFSSIEFDEDGDVECVGQVSMFEIDEMGTARIEEIEVI